jgi:hypothetical protein
MTFLRIVLLYDSSVWPVALAAAPSTMLRMVPLPRFAGEDFPLAEARARVTAGSGTRMRDA